jgi:hypothetical protein
MRKTIFLTLALLIGLSLGATGVLADSFILNNTVVSRTDNPTVFANDGRVNPIQDPGSPDFNTFGAVWNSATQHLSIYTNWTNTFDTVPNPLGYDGFVKTADLFIDTNNDKVYDFSVGLSQARLGNIYNGGTTNSFVNGGYVGGAYIKSAANPTAHLIGVTMADDTGNNANVVWSPLGSYGIDGIIARYIVDIDLSGQGLGDFTFLWASGTCGNGPMEGQVPIPPTALLMGGGLLGLVGLGWRRRQKG